MKPILKRARLILFEIPESPEEAELIIVEERFAPVVTLGSSVFDLSDENIYPILETEELDEDIVRQGFLACEIEPFIVELGDTYMILEQQYWQAKLEKLEPKIQHYEQLLKQKKLVLFRDYSQK